MRRSSVSLKDEAGLRVTHSVRAGSRKKRIAAASTVTTAACQSRPSKAFEQRRRMLEFWLAASGAEVSMRTCEQTECAGSLSAIDAEQAHLVVDGLATPMGVYPSAMVRTGDLLYATVSGQWHLPAPLPARPRWVDDADACDTDADADDSDGHSRHANGANVRTTLAGDLEGGNQHRAEADGTACDGDASRVERSCGNDSAALVATAAAGSTLANEKYFVQRFMLFSRYDEGVQLDEEGWFSVTPEVLARHMAQRCRCDLIVDAFTGVGGNAIQFAYESERVIAIDLDEPRLRLAQHNARVYEVADRIEWLHGDFLALAPSLRADVVFLSPPWGGPNYADATTFDIVTMMGGLDGAAVLRAALDVAPNVAYFLPKNADERQIAALAAEAGVAVEIEACRLNGHLKGLVAYFGFEDEDEDAERHAEE